MNNIATPTKKLERTKCELCGLEAPAPIVVDGKCTNLPACERRVERLERGSS